MGTDLNVVTGPPCSGKSSTLREIAQRGNVTFPEVARCFFDDKLSEGYESKEEIEEEFIVTAELDGRQMGLEHKILSNPGLQELDSVWLDRSLADNIAYRRHYGVDVPKTTRSEVKDRYDNVYFLEMLDYENDSVREESEGEAMEIGRHIIETYQDIGYSVKKVPVMPIWRRANVILRDYKNV